MIVIHKGKKIAEGAVQEMLDPARTQVIIDTTDNTATFAKLRETTWASSASYTDDLIKMNISKNKVPELISSLTEMGTRIISVQPRHSLEAYFLSLTNADTHVEPFAN